MLRFLSRIILIAVVASVWFVPATAQPFQQSATIPNFWDPNIRLAKPEGLKVTRLRFLTTTDFPPFNFIDRDKLLSGFHVDLARQICAELEIMHLCQIQALPWAELENALKSGHGEAIIAGLEMNYEQKKKYNFSMPFLHIPARFAALAQSDLNEPLIAALFRKKTALVRNSAHAALFKSMFKERQYVEFDTLADAKQALINKQVDVLFSDAVSLSFWLTSKSAANCCRFVGGAYISREYLGNGLTIAVTKKNPELVEAINFALRKISDNGTFRELYLRYFPLSLF